MAAWPVLPDSQAIETWRARAMELWRTRRLGRLAVILSADGKVIGDAGLTPTELPPHFGPVTDLGFIIHADFHGHGYGTEAARGLLDHAHRTLPADAAPLVCHMAETHAASRRVAEKLGLRELGRFPNPKNGGRTHVVYGAHEAG